MKKYVVMMLIPERLNAKPYTTLEADSDDEAVTGLRTLSRARPRLWLSLSPKGDVERVLARAKDGLVDRVAWKPRAGGGDRRPAKAKSRRPPTLAREDTDLETWFERDRAHVSLRRKDTDAEILDFWDEDVTQAVEDGFLNPRDWKGSLFDYAVHLGLIRESSR